MDITFPDAANLSDEMLQLTSHNTMLTWRAELEEALPSFVWETAARERSRDETFEKDEKIWKGRLNSVKCLPLLICTGYLIIIVTRARFY